MSKNKAEDIIMNKINGYTEEEAKSLVEYVSAGKRSGKSLSGLFASYAKKNRQGKGQRKKLLLRAFAQYGRLPRT